MTKEEYIKLRLETDERYQTALFKFNSVLRYFTPIISVNLDTNEVETMIPYDGANFDIIQDKLAQVLKLSATIFAMEYDSTFGDGILNRFLN